jgi:hypothetical protein
MPSGDLRRCSRSQHHLVATWNYLNQKQALNRSRKMLNLGIATEHQLVPLGFQTVNAQ